MNINRDFLIILDVKSGEVDSPNIYYFNTDKNTSNLYVQMVIRETTVEATPIENASEYSIKANILKPNMVAKEVEGTLVNPGKAIYEFSLPADCTDFSGNAKIEFEVYAGEKIATSFATKFKVHGSILTEQNKYIEDSSDYPILKELMAEVKVINETAHELDTTIRTLQADMIDANEEMKTNEVTRQANETTRVANEEARVEAERTRVNQEATRVEAETTREEQEATRVTNENDRIYKEDRRESQERDRTSNEYDRQNAEQSREYAEIDRVANEEQRQTNEANREAAEEIRKANEEARITAENARVTEHEQMRTELNEVKAENAILMENDKKIADRMTQVEISDKRQYVIMEGLMNSAGDGYLKIEDTGNDTTLYNSVEGFVDVKNITGNTMVNSIKNSDDEFTLNGDINTSGQSVTLTTAVDNGQVDVLAEGNTMVNVCDQKDPVAITTDTNTFPLRYLYTSTEYTLQFESDTAVTIDITLGGYTLSSQNIVIGLNKINIITPNELTDNNLILNGTGFNASNIVVTEATDKDFGYFSGMKSVGELEENTIEIVSANGTDSIAEGYLSNSKQILLNEPLRAVGDTKDRFVQIDGKWYVERNCAEIVLNGSEDWTQFNIPNEGTTAYARTDLLNLAYGMDEKALYCDKIKSVNGKAFDYNEEMIYSYKIVDVNKVYLHLNVSKLSSQTLSAFKAWLQANPLTVVYQLASPIYEPVEIAPTVNTYTDVTHITNNSTIPMNMPVVNSGYEVIAKPSTKYTVVGITNGRIGDSTIVNGTITTPATLDDPFLRPYGTGKTSKVMLLEGEPANIPSYFKGIKSVFEDMKVTDEADENFGKYKVEVKVVGKNKFNTYFENTVGDRCESKIPIYFDSHKSYVLTMPKLDELQGSNAVQLYLMEHRGYPYPVSDKAEGVVQLIADWWVNSKFKFTPKKSGYFYIQFRGQSSAVMGVTNIQLEEGTVATEYEPYHETKQTLYLDEPLYNTNNITIYNDKLGYWKNTNSITLTGDEWMASHNPSNTNLITFRLSNNCNDGVSGDLTTSSNNFAMDMTSGLLNSNRCCRVASYSNKNSLFLCISKGALQTQDIDGFRQWLKDNPTTVVYQLAEPVFVPLIDNCPNWVIGSWDNCSIHFDSIIPLKDTRYRYTGNVPSVMTMSEDVAEAKSISDEQDALLIDMATELAVIKLTM